MKQAPDGQLYTSESELQKACVRNFRTVWQPFGLFLFSIPNGAKIGGHITRRGFPVMAAILVGEGLTEGVADLLLAIARGGFHGLFIEMKTIVGVLSDKQRDFLERQAGEGYAVAVCKTVDEFEKTISDYMTGKFVQTPVWLKSKNK